MIDLNSVTTDKMLLKKKSLFSEVNAFCCVQQVGWLRWLVFLSISQV